MRRSLLSAALGLLLPAAPVQAERLAIRSYAIADGLAHDHVLSVTPDSRGFVWLGTAGGLSRFDGRRFVNYGTAHGLSEPYVNDFLETRGGQYWVATNGGGVFRFDPASSRFLAHPVGSGSASNRVNVVVEDARGRLWAGTDDGLHRGSLPAPRFERVELPDAPRPQVRDLAVSGDDVWVAASTGLYRHAGDRVSRLLPRQAGFHSLSFDDQGRLWAGHDGGMLVLDEAGARDVARHDAFAGEAARVILRRADGRVVAGGRNERGLTEWDGDAPREYTLEHGLADTVVTALAEDARGNLWIGTETRGVMRLAPDGFRTFLPADGLGHRRVVSIFETRANELVVLTAMRSLNRYEGRGFVSRQPRLGVPSTVYTAHATIQDREGGWWAATPKGLARYAAAPGLDELARAEPVALYTRTHGLVADDVGRPFEDSHGDIWVTVGGGASIARWDRASGAFHRYGAAEGLPADNAPVTFGEDAGGRLWLGFREGGLARRAGERFEFFGADAGLPAAMTRDLHRDAQGRFWAATTGGGLLRIEDQPGPPRVRRYTTADGLSTDHVRCLTDDGQGRLYLGTAVGVDRFDPDRGTVTHFTTADGLAQNEVQAAYRDREGALWFGTMNGVSRLEPAERAAAAPSPVLIAAVSVGGVARPLSALGERDVPEFSIGAGDGGVRVEYFVTDFATGGPQLFEYRLAGAERGWSARTPRDSVELAALRPGRYRFEVRSVGAGGPGAPAAVSFVVHPPFWRSAWFVGAAAATLALLGYRFHRSRVRRALELERVRTRIATDLHDDIGASLSQIAIWSEVAARGSGEAGVRETLGGIASACRETVDAMGDIVWAVNPAHDRLGDLVHRMRRFASDVFTARDVDFRFDSSLPDQLPLATDLRRQVLLVFKEAVNNAARHSRCGRAEAHVAVANGRLTVTLRDDGVGFEAGSTPAGHGLASMAARARDLGGTLAVTSAPGRGSTVALEVPVREPHLRRWARAAP